MARICLTIKVAMTGCKSPMRALAGAGFRGRVWVWLKDGLRTGETMSGRWWLETITRLATGNYDVGSRQTSVHKHSVPPQAFTAQTNWSEKLIACPASAAGNFIIGFSPAFIFSNLPRGPPAHKAKVLTCHRRRTLQKTEISIWMKGAV